MAGSLRQIVSLQRCALCRSAASGQTDNLTTVTPTTAGRLDRPEWVMTTLLRAARELGPQLDFLQVCVLSSA